MEKNEKDEQVPIKETISPKNVKKIQEKYRQIISHELNQGKKTITDLENRARKNIDANSKSYVESIKSHSSKLKQNSLEIKEEFDKKSPKFFRKIKKGFFGFFESLVGSIKIGSQYGSTSLELLEKMAKLKELGIITEKEFIENKKKILKRI
jgi:hypothetical protein